MIITAFFWGGGSWEVLADPEIEHLLESHGIYTGLQDPYASPVGGSQEFDEQSERIPLIRLFNERR